MPYVTQWYHLYQWLLVTLLVLWDKCAIQIYGVKGVGGILLNAISETNPDHDLAMAALAFYTIIGLATTLVVDLSYGIVDPRIRMGAK